MTMFWKSLIRNSAGCTKFNFCRVSSYSYVCIRPFINRDKYILAFVLYIKISWVQRTHCLCQGKFWFLVVSNFDQRQNNEVNTCIRGVPSFSKESQSEICAWIVRNEFKSSSNNCCCSLSFVCPECRACAWSFIKGELFGLLNQCTSDFCSFKIGHLKLPFKIPCSSSAKLIFIPSSEFKKLFLQKWIYLI